MAICNINFKIEFENCTTNYFACVYDKTNEIQKKLII